MVDSGVLDINLEEELFKLQEEIIKIRLLTSSKNNNLKDIKKSCCDLNESLGELNVAIKKPRV